MSKAEKFISDYTKNCSNEIGYCHNKTRNHNHVFYDWLTPAQARKAVEIAREEMLEEICVWLHHNAELYGDSLMQHYDDDRLINDLKQVMKDE